MRTAWRRIGPWITPVLVLAEVVLVWTGVLSLLDAVIVIVVEILLAVAVIGRRTVAIRAFRGDRRGGEDVWTAAGNGLSEILPRPWRGHC